MTMDRFELMAAQLACAPVPPLPDIPGRFVVAVIDDADAMATAWETNQGPLTATDEKSVSKGSAGRGQRLRRAPAARRIRCASGLVTRTGLVARLLQRVPRAEATLARLWTLLQAELTAEGLQPVEVKPGQLQFQGGVFTRESLAALASRARHLAKQAAHDAAAKPTRSLRPQENA